MKKVLITGGSRGIGAACVKKFTREGCEVVFFYRNSCEAAEKLARETGATPIRVDLSDLEAARNAVKEAIGKLGGLDVLVNNAGICQSALFTDLSDADWRRMMANDLDSVYAVTQEAAGTMIRQHGGSIVTVGSMWGKTGASCEVSYSTAKAGLRGMTMALAKELGPSNIRVNCVEPGVIDTDMNAALTEETMRELCDGTPLCRIGKPEEVADAIRFLSSDEAGFITGQILGVDGGFAI